MPTLADSYPGWSWVAWLAGGVVMDSVHHSWEQVQQVGTVLVVRYWSPIGGGIAWGDSLYGHPATLAGGATVGDKEFMKAMEEARGHSNPPS